MARKPMAVRTGPIVSYWKRQWERDTHGGESWDSTVPAFITRHLRLTRRTTLLDVGCASGRLLRLLPGRKTGVDYSPAKIREARKALPKAKLIVGEAADLPFKDGSFDAVLTHSTFLHFDADYALAALSELERVCKKGGRVLVGDVPEISKFKGGTWWYRARTAFLRAAGKGHYVCYDRAYFERKGYRTYDSPFNDRFYALKIKNSRT